MLSKEKQRRVLSYVKPQAATMIFICCFSFSLLRCSSILHLVASTSAYISKSKNTFGGVKMIHQCLHGVVFYAIFSKALPVSQIIKVLDICPLWSEITARHVDVCAFCIFLSAPLPGFQKPLIRCTCLFYYPKLEPKQ